MIDRFASFAHEGIYKQIFVSLSLGLARTLRVDPGLGL